MKKSDRIYNLYVVAAVALIIAISIWLSTGCRDDGFGCNHKNTFSGRLSKLENSGDYMKRSSYIKIKFMDGRFRIFDSFSEHALDDSYKIGDSVVAYFRTTKNGRFPELDSVRTVREKSN